MEPGHEDREDSVGDDPLAVGEQPQWSPVTKTGKTFAAHERQVDADRPQWSPVTKTGKTRYGRWLPHEGEPAAMEPGHEDREDRSHK